MNWRDYPRPRPFARAPSLRGCVAVIALMIAALAVPGSAAAQIEILDGDRPGIELGGYVRSLTGLRDAGHDTPGEARRTGFHGQVVRLRWRLTWGDDVVLSVHNRLQTTVASSAGAFGGAAGLGVSVIPGRPVDLSTRIVSEDRIAIWHDVDRLALTVYTGAADITIGRQAITWGLAQLFPVADVWALFSPFELDTEEKPGVDAVRVLSYPADRLELDAVVAARGRAEDWSAGVRATHNFASADVYLAAGKLWNQLMVLGGVAYLLDRITLRGEAAVPWVLGEDSPDRPRITIGFDRPGMRLSFSGEYHYGGAGAESSASYMGHLSDPRLRRGEVYLLGRHYLGAAVSFIPTRDERLSLALSALLNAGDGSASLTPLLNYDVGQSASVSLGAIHSFGERPSLDPPSLPSEFGAYGHLWFARVSVFF